MRHKDDDKLNSIYQATMELVTEIGLSQTSVSKIAKKANISPSTIYVYFESKEDLLIKLYVKLKKQMMIEIYRGIDESVPFKIAYEKSLSNFIQHLVENRNIFLFVEQFGNSPLENKITEKDSLDIFQDHDDFYKKGKNEGLLKIVDTNLLVTFTYYPAMQLVKSYFAGLIKLEDAEVETIISMSWNAIKF